MNKFTEAIVVLAEKALEYEAMAMAMVGAGRLEEAELYERRSKHLSDAVMLMELGHVKDITTAGSENAEE